jgi:hypothetical protein
MNMSETTSGRTNTVSEFSVSKEVTKPEPVYPIWDGYGDIPPRVVALEHLWNSLRVLVFGKAATDAKD